MLTRFRNRHDEKVIGISQSAKVLRKRRNLVSMRFNMMNWLLETVSLILVMIKDNVFMSIIYLLVTSCGTPLVNFIMLQSEHKRFKKTLITDVLGLLSWH